MTNIYLSDDEMVRWLTEVGLEDASNDQLADLAHRYDVRGHELRSTGAWFMRYSLIGFVERRKPKDSIGLSQEQYERIAAYLIHPIKKDS